MTNFLNNAYAQKTMIDDVGNSLVSKKTEFDNIKLDFLVIILYANFERDLNAILEKKLISSNNFHNNYIDFLKNKNQKLHRGISQKHFRELLEQIFNVERSKIITENEWSVFCAFMNFRHSIAHCLPDYQQNKSALIGNMKNTDNLINVFDSILKKLDNVKRIKKR